MITLYELINQQGRFSNEDKLSTALHSLLMDYRENRCMNRQEMMKCGVVKVVEVYTKPADEETHYIRTFKLDGRYQVVFIKNMYGMEAHFEVLDKANLVSVYDSLMYLVSAMDNKAEHEVSKLKKVTTKSIEEAIRTRFPEFPEVDLIKENGYFYISSLHNDTGCYLAGLETTSIEICHLYHFSLEQWMWNIESLLYRNRKILVSENEH